jgi:hypothetical protein
MKVAKRKVALLCMMLAALPVALQATTQSEEDRIVINPVNASDFEVIHGINFGAAEFWCGAATYVERRSGLSELTAVYVKRALGPSTTAPGRKGVVFSTSNAGLPAADPGRVTLTVDVVGATLKSAQARRYCRDAFTRSTK